MKREVYTWTSVSFPLKIRILKTLQGDSFKSEPGWLVSQESISHYQSDVVNKRKKTKCLPLDVRPDKTSGLSEKSCLSPPVAAAHCGLLLSGYSKERQRSRREREKERKKNT